jgi:hypothetical protein
LIRYVNTDYVVYYVICGTELLVIYISYDIMCQYGKHFAEWMVEKFSKKGENKLQFATGGVEMNYLIPKF